MGDAVASSSSPVTPTSILICREDGNGIFPDADDGADFSVAGEDRLLAVDQDDEYFAVLLSKERASADAGAPTEELEEWMMAARSGRVRWIIKVIPALFPFFCRVHILLAEKIRSFLLTRGVHCVVLCRPPRCSGSAGRRRTSR
jgi:cyclin D5, plant